MPFFTVHGNHDDPAGSGALSALDLLSVANFINYFGKVPSVDQIALYPILLQKGTTRVALYGLGNVRDERLYRTFQQQVTFPTFFCVFILVNHFFSFLLTLFYFSFDFLESSNDASCRRSWFLVQHFCFASESSCSFTKELRSWSLSWRMAWHCYLGPWSRLSFLVFFFNRFNLKFLAYFFFCPIVTPIFIQHECLITPSPSAVGHFFISQPGSSVQTSLSDGEAKQKFVGLLEVRGDKFRMRPKVI